MATLAGLFLVTLAAGLVWSQWRSRGAVASASQFRRRILTGTLLGVLGLAIIAGQFIVATARPLAFMMFWLAVLAMTGVLGLSGFVGLLTARRSGRRALRDQEREMIRLRADLAKLQQERGSDERD